MPTPHGGNPRKPGAPARPHQAQSKAQSGPIPLAPEEVSPVVVPAAAKARETKDCPGCGRPMPGAAWVCGACGFDIREGRKPIPKPKPCVECGYDLTGVTNETCPECNTPIRRGRSSLLADARQIRRDTYRKTLMGIGIGLAGVFIGAGVKGAPGLLLATVMCWPIAIVMYAAAKMLWDALDEPWSVVALKACAVLSVASGAAAILLPANFLSALSMGGFGRLCAIEFCVVGALMTSGEEEAEDACAYSIPFVVLGAFGPPNIVAFLF